MGEDTYLFNVKSSAGRSIWEFGQGFGAAGGIGVVLDSWGNDKWLSYGLESPGLYGFEGVYTQGTGFYGGVGVMADVGRGNDVYDAAITARTPDYYAQGFGAFGGFGILYEDGGDDTYSAVEIATNPWINPILNCAFGTGSYAGVGIMVELGGTTSRTGAAPVPTAPS